MSRVGIALACALSLLPAVSRAQESRFVKRTVTYKSVGSCDIQADIYRLPDSARPPVVLWIHGGALILGNRGMIPAQHVERLLREGFAVVSIDYRLAPETKLPGIVSDIEDAYRWVRQEGSEQFALDRDRIAVVGRSAGGYLALVSGVRVRPRPTALVSFYGYGELTAPWLATPDPFYGAMPAVTEAEAHDAVGNEPIAQAAGLSRGAFYLYCRQQGLWPLKIAGVDPALNPDFFAPFEPHGQVSSAYPPTLLLHGDQDSDVPFEQSMRMAAQLKRLGVEHELVRIPGGGHGFDMDVSKPEVVSALDRVSGFLRSKLGQDVP